MVRIGLEVLTTSQRDVLAGQRVGLVVNPSSVDSQYRHAVDLLAGDDAFDVTTLFGPQHGIRGETQDNMIEWEGFTDSRTGLPVYSLYGETRIPYPEMLANVDTLVFDMQDVGTRIYTFIYTMAHCMEAAARATPTWWSSSRPRTLRLRIRSPVSRPAFTWWSGQPALISTRSGTPPRIPALAPTASSPRISRSVPCC